VTTSRTAAVMGLIGPRREYYQGTEVNIRTGAARPLLSSDVGRAGSRPVTLNTLDAPPIIVRTADGRPHIYVEGTSFQDETGVLTLFDATDAQTRIVYAGGLTTQDLAVSPTGAVIGKVEYDQATGAWALYAGPDRSRLQKIRSGVNKTGYPEFVGVSADGATVYVNSGSAQDPALSVVDVRVGQWRDLSGDEATGALVTDDASNRALATVTLGETRHDYRFLDAEDDRLWRATVKGFVDADVQPVSFAADRSSLLVAVDGPKWGYAIYRIDRKTHAAAFVADYYAHVPPEQIARQTVIHYKAADGLDIPAYLTLPVDRPARGLSLIVLPHGGPFARDEPGFDWWAQALASRGYAVLQPQFRGSDGFGARFLEAGYGEYGGKMQTDLSDGAAWLAKAGTIDPGRVAIMGASYGGYAALAGVTLQTGVYRCAVSVAGPSDMRRQMAYLREEANGDGQTINSRYWREYLAVKSDTDPRLDAISPAKHAAAATVPVLLIHGRDDTVVPIDQSRRMADALRAAGHPAQLVELKGEDHHLSSSETRLQMLESAVAFLQGCDPAG